MFEKESQEAEMTPSEITEVKAPKAMTEDEVRKVQIEAEEIVARLEDASGGEGLELLDNIANVGLQAERKAAGQLNLLRSRVGSFLNEGGTSKEIADGLRDLRANLDKINPQELTHQGIRDRVLAALPLLKGRYNPVARTLHKIALRYEPVSRQVAVIETKLSEGQAMLDRDNVELRMLYEDVEAQQLPIQRNAYLGELLIQHLSRLMEQSEDPAKRERVQGALSDVAIRVNDLRTMEEVHIQYMVSIGMGRQNNTRLGQSVERTLNLATNVVTIGLAIQSALIRQKRVMEASNRTREFLGDLVTANAAAINQHTREIGDLQHQPVIAMDKITQAHNDLVEALDTANRLREEGIEAARNNIAELSQMSGSLAQRVSGKLQESLPGSVEA
ncbi:MAG: toxic anion resistance protein [Chloroflexi bacterium]|nr:toxic anion resistance protein [Chloroflexota bacterium]